MTRPSRSRFVLTTVLKGKNIAGRAGWPFCLAAFDESLGGEVFTATIIALGAGDAAAIALVRSAALRSPALPQAYGSLATPGQPPRIRP